MIHKYLKPLPYVRVWGWKFKSKDFQKLTFEEVTYIKKYLSKGEPEKAFYIVFGLKFWVLRWVGEIRLIRAYNHILKEIEILSSWERGLFNDSEDPLLKQAGSKRLDKYDTLNITHPLGERFSKDPQDIEQWPYVRVIWYAAYSKDSSEVMNNYQKLMNDKR